MTVCTSLARPPRIDPCRRPVAVVATHNASSVPVGTDTRQQRLSSSLVPSSSQGHRAALPSSSIMIKQPVSLFRGQATDLEIQRQEIRQTKQQLVEILAKGCGKTEEEMERDISRPKYFTPYQAVEYGLIDRVRRRAACRTESAELQRAEFAEQSPGRHGAMRAAMRRRVRVQLVYLR